MQMGNGNLLDHWPCLDQLELLGPNHGEWQSQHAAITRHPFLDTYSAGNAPPSIIWMQQMGRKGEIQMLPASLVGTWYA